MLHVFSKIRLKETHWDYGNNYVPFTAYGDIRAVFQKRRARWSACGFVCYWTTTVVSFYDTLGGPH